MEKRSAVIKTPSAKSYRTESVLRDSNRVMLAEIPEQEELFAPQRRRLPNERNSITHEFCVGSQEGYLTVGMYDDQTPGEIFIKMAEEGSTLAGLMDGLAVLMSIGLQYGVPLKTTVDKLMNTRFEPCGSTSNPDIVYATSVLDYIARWLGAKFICSKYLKIQSLNMEEKVSDYCRR